MSKESIDLAPKFLEENNRGLRLESIKFYVTNDFAKLSVS